MEPPTRVSVSIRSELYDEVLRRFLDALHAVNHEEELELVQRGHSEYPATVKLIHEHLLNQRSTRAQCWKLPTRFSKKVRLSLQTDHVHPLERVLNIIVFGHAQSDQKSVSYELDILFHES